MLVVAVVSVCIQVGVCLVVFLVSLLFKIFLGHVGFFWVGFEGMC